MKFINLKNLHIYFFYFFLFSIPFQTRKVFLTDHSFYSGAFTEYTTFFLYLSDILLIITLFLWLILSKSLIKRLDFNKLRNAVYKNKVWTYLLFFFFFLGLNLIFKRDYLEISFFQFLKLLELILLSLYVYFNLNKAKWLFNSLLVLSISGFTQGIIAIFQFTGQRSFFKSEELLRKITGESLIGADISGVAKFVFEGQKIVRSYGTFSHPNVLGGFLIFTILITILLYLESKSGYLSSKVSNFQLFSLYNNTKRSISQGITYSLFWIIMIFVQISALFLTFSRVSWISFILAVIILLIVYIIYLYNVSRETNSDSCSSFDKKGLFIDRYSYKNFFSISSYQSKNYTYHLNSAKSAIIKLKELFIVILLLIILIISNFSIIQARIGDNLLSADSRLPDNSAISDRNFYNNVSRETISNNPLFGSGLGTFIFQIDEYLEKNNIEQKLEPWQYQPAHNIYFLICSEIGVIGLLFFLLFLVYGISSSIKIVSRETIQKNYSSLNKGRLVGIVLKKLRFPLYQRGLGGFCEESQDSSLNKSLNMQKISL